MSSYNINLEILIDTNTPDLKQKKILRSTAAYLNNLADDIGTDVEESTDLGFEIHFKDKNIDTVQVIKKNQEVIPVDTAPSQTDTEVSPEEIFSKKDIIEEEIIINPVTERVNVDILAPKFYPGGLDSLNNPWNAELHSSNKTKNKDGTWKKKRGLEMPGKSMESAPISTSEPVDAEPFDTLMTLVTSACTSRKVTPGQILGLTKAEGYPDLIAIQDKPEIIKKVTIALQGLLNV